MGVQCVRVCVISYRTITIGQVVRVQGCPGAPQVSFYLEILVRKARVMGIQACAHGLFNASVVLRFVSIQ